MYLGTLHVMFLVAGGEAHRRLGVTCEAGVSPGTNYLAVLLRCTSTTSRGTATYYLLVLGTYPSTSTWYLSIYKYLVLIHLLV